MRCLACKSCRDCAAFDLLCFFPFVLGCVIRHAGNSGYYCTHRQEANYYGAIQVFASSIFFIIIANSDGGAAFDLKAAMALEISRPEGLALTFAAAASTVALFLFATREAVLEDKSTTEYFIKSVSTVVFLGCWVVAGLAIGLNTNEAREKRVACRSQKNVLPDQCHGVLRAAITTELVVLPRLWSCIFVALSFFSYTTPATIRLVFGLGSLRGAVSSFANQCFVVHVLLLATDERSSARAISTVHLAVMLVGNVSSFIADLESLGVAIGLISLYVFRTFGYVFSFWLWYRVIKPMLKFRNAKLHDRLPVVIFRWFFRGGLAISGFCYFEALGVGFDNHRDSMDIEPWLIANSIMIKHLTFSTALAVTLVADARTSFTDVLRGRAPVHVMIALAVTLCNSLLSLALFAGREFSGRQQQLWYRTAETTFTFLWCVTGCCCWLSLRAARHHAQRSTSRTTISAPTEVDDHDVSASQRRDSFLATFGSAAVTTSGI